MSYIDKDGYVRQHLPSVATTGRMSNERRLDAFPDLLAACKAWIAEVKAGVASGMNSDVIEQTEAAIARAEGRQ